MATLTEAAAMRLGRSVVSSDGAHIHGKDALGMSGAHGLACVGRSLPVIQIMARVGLQMPLQGTLWSFHCPPDRDSIAGPCPHRTSKRSAEMAREEVAKMKQCSVRPSCERCSLRYPAFWHASIPFVLQCGGAQTHVVASGAVELLLVHEWNAKFG